jgi:hypothetical protein
MISDGKPGGIGKGCFSVFYKRIDLGAQVKVM